MSTKTAYRTLDEVEIASRPDVTSIQVTLSYIWENDGIGHYEYWGSVGFDRGTNYVTIEDYSYDQTGMTVEEIATIDSMIETMMDDWANSIADENNDNYGDDDYEPEPSNYYYEEP